MMKLHKVEFPVLIPETIGLNRKDMGRPVYRLETNFIAIIDGFKHVIPAGIEFDYASIPRFLWSLFLPYDPQYAAATLLHDTSYQGILWPREVCDKLFLSGMIATDVPKLKRNTMYAGVRAGGWYNYDKRNLPKMPIVRGLMGLSNIDSIPLWTNV